MSLTLATTSHPNQSLVDTLHHARDIYNMETPHRGKSIEYEVRFGRFDKNKFVPQISPAAVRRINRSFSMPGFTEENRKSTVEIMDTRFGSIRKIITHHSNHDSVEWQLKKTIHKWNVTDYNLRVAVSSEQIIDEYPHFKPTARRIRTRTSYIFDDHGQVDVTDVDPGGGQEKVSEVEIEFYHNAITQFRVNYLITMVKRVLGLINDTHLIYTTAERSAVMNRFNALMGSKMKSSGVDKKRITQARNIKYRDIVFTGLIGGDVVYQVTNKADGFRKFFIIWRNTVWLISPSSDVDKVAVLTTSEYDNTILDCELIPNNATHRNVESGARREKYWLVILDGLVIKGYSKLSIKNHNHRMFQAQAIANRFSENGLIRLTTKEFKTVDSPASLFSSIRYLSNIRRPYKTDGLMFIPNDTPYVPYDPNPDTLSLTERCLSEIPDIVKWKDRSEITIDLMVNWTYDEYGGKVLNLLTSRSITQGKRAKFDLVPFTGNSISPFNMNMLEMTDDIRAAKSGTVWEFIWIPDREMLRPVKARYDKKFPNREEIAVDNWIDVNDPIELDTMKGLTMRLMRKYHNRVKKSLFKHAAGAPQKANLLDIGSGRGGDVFKMFRFKKVVLVEPEFKHIEILLDRLVKTPLADQGVLFLPAGQDRDRAIQLIDAKHRDRVDVINHIDEVQPGTQRVLIIQTGGENYLHVYKGVNKFFGGPADVISMMFSLSFFWSSVDMLKRLAITLAISGTAQCKFIFTTIDGNTIKQVFRPPLGGAPVEHITDYDNLINITYNTEEEIWSATTKPDNQDLVNIKYHSDGIKSINVSFRDTIVGRDDESQTEWLVIITDLVKLLRARAIAILLNEYQVDNNIKEVVLGNIQDFELKTYHRMQDEYVLTPLEQRMTNLYYFGVMSRSAGPLGRLTLDTSYQPNDVLPIEIVNIRLEHMRGKSSEMLNMGHMIRTIIRR